MPNITIQLPTKIVAFLKSKWKVDDVTPILQKILDDNIKHYVETQYESKKTLDQKIDELSN